MNNSKRFIVSHAPFWHDGSSIFEKNYTIMLAALPALFLGLATYGGLAVGVIALSVSSAIFWELAMNHATKRPITIGDGQAALIGLLFGMMLPVTMPWWAVITGTLVAVVIGKEIFGGIGSNPFNPAALSVAILMVSWKDLFNFDVMLLNYDLGFAMAYPLASLKHFGVESVAHIDPLELLFGRQTGGIGSTFGMGLILGGFFLCLRGFIRWEIPVSFLAGVFFTALMFHIVDPTRFAGPFFHMFTGYTLIGAFFLATDDSSSPVNFIPMLLYGAVGGIMTVLIRNIGVYVDGVVLAILVANLLSPVLDKIRPKAMGKVV